MTQLETEIREVLDENHVTFAELSRIDGFGGGEMCIEFGEGKKNILAWAGMSEEAVEILRRLEAEGVFHFDHHGTSTFLCYLVDGVQLNLPLAKRAKHYKEPHWLPVTLVLGPNEIQREARKNGGADART
jgi:hypothetical protein